MTTDTEYTKLADNQQGSALIFAIIVLAVLTIIGVSSITTSTIETKIAKNDRLYKMAFYEADGGTEVGREIIEQNLSCPAGFASQPLTIGTLEVLDSVFAYEENEPAGDYPTDATRDIRFPNDDSQPHTNIIAYGNTELSTGSAVQMAAGYEGKGHGAAGGGAQIIYNLAARHQGHQNSQAKIMINYRHLIGQEGNCKY